MGRNPRECEDISDWSLAGHWLTQQSLRWTHVMKNTDLTTVKVTKQMMTITNKDNKP